jgi:hypothetical protein
VPDGKRGLARVTVNLKGVEGEVGARIWKGLSASGYVGRVWKAGAVEAGARATFVW